MRRSSLRTWLFLVSVFFAVLIVGGISLTSYVIVLETMTAVARERPERVTDVNVRALDLQAEQIEDDFAIDGVLDEAGLEAAREAYLDRAESIYGQRVPSEPQIAILDSELRTLWVSSDSAVLPGLDERRRAALERGRPVQSTVERSSLFSGLTGSTVLSIHAAHAPIVLPGGEAGLLDVTYYPFREEGVIDSMRPPMAALAASAILIMVIMMQASMGWVLKLVNDLRRAADSIDAGDLDVRLPEVGEHEISELAQSINGLIDRLERRAEIQTRFMADASHELATPVAGIRGYTNILRAWGGEDPDMREEAVEAIDRESRRMARLCGDLLSLLRTDTVGDTRHVRFDVNFVAREALAACATRYHDKGLEFSGPEEGRLYIVGDPDRLEDVLSVLVDNACKYTPSGGKVRLATRLARGSVVIEVHDTGIGIPRDDLPIIFERFYRSDESRSKVTGGFGLGLAIAKGSVEAMGGAITVQSAVGAGSLFTVKIPRG